MKPLFLFPHEADALSIDRLQALIRDRSIHKIHADDRWLLERCRVRNRLVERWLVVDLIINKPVRDLTVEDVTDAGFRLVDRPGMTSELLRYRHVLRLEVMAALPFTRNPDRSVGVALIRTEEVRKEIKSHETHQ